jgi:hypothetical protein
MADSNWQAWVQIKWKSGTPSTAWEAWQGNDTVKAAWSTLGEWDSTLWLNVSTPDELEEFVWKHIRKNEWVADTKTSWAKQWW